MKITDMDVDCLESCLEHLSMGDLLNAADSNKRLKHAARYVFVRIYGQKVVNLSLLKSCKHEGFGFNDKELFIGDLKRGLQVLRCFGDLVSEMEMHFQHDFSDQLSNSALLSAHPQDVVNYMIQCSKAGEYEHLIIDYINKYCFESLTRITFMENPKDGLNKLTNTFKKVEKIVMELSFPIEKKLNELFPNIRELELNYCGSRNRDMFLQNDFFVCNFPCLEHLLILTENRSQLSKENLAMVLRLNPQLKSLMGNVWLDAIFDRNIIENANKTFQNLETLQLNVENMKYFKKNIDEIDLKNLKNLVMVFTRQDLYKSSKVRFRSDKLDSLTFNAFNKATFYNVIDKYPNVKKIRIRSSIRINPSKISKKLLSLEELYIEQNRIYFTVDEVVHFIHVLQSLKVLEIPLLGEQASENDLLTRLGNAWSLSRPVPSIISPNNLLIKLNRKF